MHKFMLILTAAAIGSLPASAQVFRAENRAQVTPAGNTFVVENGAGFGARGMWCAAADFAKKKRGAQGIQRIYVTQPRTPGIGNSTPVGFTLDAGGLTPSSVLIVGASLNKKGANLSVDHAYSFCADAKVINR